MSKIDDYEQNPLVEQMIRDVHDLGINYHTRELYLHSAHDSADDFEPGVEYKMATRFIKNIHLLNLVDCNPILCHMHVVGGNWTDGMAIFNVIKSSCSPFTLVAYAQASSMSGIILQAADHRLLMPDCEVMLHYGSIGIESDLVRVRSTVKINDVYCQRMLDIFAERAVTGKYFKSKNMDKRAVSKFIHRKLQQKGDWYLQAEEAVFYGLADAIAEPNKEIIPTDNKFVSNP